MKRDDLVRLSKAELVEAYLALQARMQRPSKTSRTSSKPPSTDKKARREHANLAVVLEVFPRKIVGWAIGWRMKTKRVLDALNRAVQQRKLWLDSVFALAHDNYPFYRQRAITMRVGKPCGWAH